VKVPGGGAIAVALGFAVVVAGVGARLASNFMLDSVRSLRVFLLETA